MQLEAPMAFVARAEVPPLEIRVNFGIFAGRQATPAEIDDLARDLLPEVGEVSIVAEERHELSEESEVSVHQVRVEVAGGNLPDDERALGELSARLVALCERWAQACIADRHAEVSEL